MSEGLEIAVVGATGTVGEALLEALGESGWPLTKIHALASEGSAGKRMEVGGGYATVAALEGFDFASVALALFAVPDSVAEAHLPSALEAGCRVIDFSAAFHGDERARLAVAGVNDGELDGASLVVSPSAAAVALAPVLAALGGEAGIESVTATVLEPASIRGRAGVKALAGEAARLLNGQPAEPSLFPQQLAFNLLAHPVSAGEAGWSGEELRLERELRAVLNDEALAVHATVVQAPLFFGQAIALRVVTREPLDAPRARALLEALPALELVEGEGSEAAPSPTTDAVGEERVLVGRIRAERSGRGLDLWLASDNVRVGGAANGVQIAGQLLKEYL